jgi:probable rRNA maturation factor
LVANSKKSGLILILEVGHDFSSDVRDKIFSLHEVAFPLLKIPTSSFVNVVLCDRQKSAELNNNFAKKNKATDVLSFCYKEQGSFLKGFPFGEIIICKELCERQALENQWSFEVEFLRLLVHGLAHLGGYQHESLEQERQMLNEEKKILKICKLGFVYSEKL